MSNPLAVFRKNRNYWMAGLVLLAILAFVVAPAIQTASEAFRGGADGQANAVVVRWNGGKMTVGDVRHATTQHGRLVRFLSALAKKVLDAGGQPGVPDAGYDFDQQLGQVYVVGINMISNEQSICQTRIMAEYAKRMGVELTDRSADDFLELFCDGRVSTEEFDELRIETTDGQLSEFEIRELLKTEMAAKIAGRMAATGAYAQTPGKTWRDFLKLNQTAKVSAFPVFVDDYLKEVKSEPTETEIQAIYDDGSTRASNPSSSEPGFIRRYHANFEYVQASFQDWVETEKAKLTDEEIRKEYDRRVELKLLEVPVEEAASEEPAAEETSVPESTEPPESKETPETSNETPAVTPPGTSTEVSPAATSETGTAPAEATESPEGTEPSPGTEPSLGAESSPGTDASEGTQPAEKASSSETDQSRAAQNATRFVSFVQEGQSPPPVVQPPQLGEATTATPQSTEDPTAETGSTEAGATKDAPAMRTKTFEEAREDIAEELARTNVIPKLDEVLTKVMADEMTPYYGAFRQFRAFRESGVDTGEGGEMPSRPDLKKYAEGNNLQYGETGLVDGVQIARTPFGLSEIPRDESGVSGMVANAIMGPHVELFKPLQSYYMDRVASMQTGKPIGSQYIFWKTAERPAYIPELTEVRDEVIDAWKRIQARKLAEAAAQELSKKVGSSTDPWDDALSTAEKSLVIETDPFSWMSGFGERPDISVVPKLDAVGLAFMQQVFNTPVGQNGVAPNANKGIYYVYRVMEIGPTDDELRERFNADPLKSGPISIGRFESEQSISSWYQNLEKELGVEWQIPTNQF